jgi:hypothetical protein
MAASRERPDSRTRSGRRRRRLSPDVAGRAPLGLFSLLTRDRTFGRPRETMRRRDCSLPKGWSIPGAETSSAKCLGAVGDGDFGSIVRPLRCQPEGGLLVPCRIDRQRAQPDPHVTRGTSLVRSQPPMRKGPRNRAFLYAVWFARCPGCSTLETVWKRRPGIASFLSCSSSARAGGAVMRHCTPVTPVILTAILPGSASTFAS